MTTTMRSGIRIVAAMAIAAVISMSAASAGAQVAGSTTIGVTKEEIKAVMEGWSAKKAILGKAVYNANRRSDGGCGRDLDERGERRRAGRGFHHDRSNQGGNQSRNGRLERQEGHSGQGGLQRQK